MGSDKVPDEVEYENPLDFDAEDEARIHQLERELMKADVAYFMQCTG